jgi:AcrR family transcriptional regulator
VKCTTRSEQRAASEAAILDAAFELYAERGPDGVSLRDVTESVGLTHAMAIRYFGSKQGLVSAVEGRLVDELSTLIDGVELATAEGFLELLTSIRRRPVLSRLLVRSGLGDLDGSTVPSLVVERCSTDGDGRVRLGAYAATCLLVGWLSWEGFLESALGLRRVSGRRRDETVAAAAATVLHHAPQLEPRRLTTSDGMSDATPASSPREALLDAAIELFAARGPASVSIRDVARHAGVHHSLVHRHFGTKDDLLAEVIEVGAFPLLPGAFAPDGFDIDSVVHALHHGSPSPNTIARILIDHIAIATVRPRTPVLDSLLDLARRSPAEARPTGLADARLAAATAVSMVVGSVIWGRALAESLGLDDPDHLEAAMADLGHWLIGVSATTATTR